MIEHIPEMIESGIDSLKIEGRMKGINYLASVVKTYREAIDSYYADPGAYTIKDDWITELACINNRGYCTGFYLGDPDQVSPDYRKSNASNGRLFVGKVLDCEGGSVNIQVRNKICEGDVIEIISRKGSVTQHKIDEIFDENRQRVSHVQPGSIAFVNINRQCCLNDLIRKVGAEP
jgi:putative protease